MARQRSAQRPSSSTHSHLTPMTLNSSRLARATALIGSALLSTGALAQTSTVVGFDGGTSGDFTGNAFFEAAGDNPDGNAHHFASLFFPELRTGAVGEPTNPNFIGDFSGFGQVTFSVDIKVDSLTNFIGNPISRPYGLKLIDRDVDARRVRRASTSTSPSCPRRRRRTGPRPP